MSRRGILGLSFALTAFALVLVGAYASRTLDPASKAPEAKTAESVPSSEVERREAELRRLVTEANARLRTQEQLLAETKTTAAGPLIVSSKHEREDELGHHAKKHHSKDHSEHRSEHGDDDDDD